MMKKIILVLLGIVSLSFLIKPLLNLVIDDELEEDVVDEDRKRVSFNTFSLSIYKPKDKTSVDALSF